MSQVMHQLTRRKIAIVVDDGFGQVELVKPRKALDWCDYRDSFHLSQNFCANVNLLLPKLE